jgi:NitT/TauT family transport system substrate-binding protein
LGVSLLLVLAVFFGSPPNQHDDTGGRYPLRLAYFPNVTHAPAVVGVARGDFQAAVGAGVRIEPKVFNAGPEAMEALLAKEIDLAYVGPGPAINAYLKSNGRALRILAGACSGGAALVARREVALSRVADLDGKTVAVPQLGGTQDISLRRSLAQEGLRSQESGGTVRILFVKNPDILALFLRGQVDAAWVPEPWGSRLIHEARARLVIDERDLWPGGRFATTVLVGRKAFLDAHPDLARAFVKGHLNVIAWLKGHPAEGQADMNAELKRLTGKALAPAILREAWSRVEFTADPLRDSIETMVDASAAAGYLPPRSVDVARLVDSSFLDHARGRQTASVR